MTRTSDTPPVAPPGPGDALLDEALALWPWASDVEAAKARARERGLRVLAVVTAAYEPKGRTEQEDLFLSTVLCHPDVVRRGREAFVPVRVVYDPVLATVGVEPGGPADPLVALGTTARDLKAPALLVATPDGEKVAALAGLGTFDPAQVLALLDAPRVPPARRGPAADYDRAARAWREGERERATGLLERIAREHPDDPWSLKARLRLAFPDRVALAEGRGTSPFSDDPLATEVRVSEERVAELRDVALDYLLETQEADGGWPVAETAAAPFRPGVSVLAAHALLLRLDGAQGARRRRVRAALDRADRYLDEHVLEADPVTLNSFAAAYHVLYRLAALERGRAKRTDVVAALRVLTGGQLENGAWSYDRRFGEAWRGGFAGWPETTKGRVHSMNTGLAVLALVEARDAGFEVDAGALAAGRDALLAMRTGPARWTYTWPEPRNFEDEENGIARAPLCEEALARAAGSDAVAVRRSLDLFLLHRGDLRAVARLSGSWLRPGSYSAYFFHFAYHHAARALAWLGDRDARRDLAVLRADLLDAVEPDGTWVDYAPIGKPYGTAMALLTLDLTDPR